MICNSCNNQIGNVKFCPFCGHPNTDFVPEEDSLLNRPTFETEDSIEPESLLNREETESDRYKTEAELFGDDLNNEPSREVFERINENKEHKFNDYENFEDTEEQSGFKSSDNEQSRSAGGSTDFDYSKSGTTRGSDGLWDLLGRVNTAVLPIIQKIYNMETLGLVLLVVVLALLQSPIMFLGFGLGMGGYDSSAASFGLFSFVTSLISVAITFFINRALFNLASGAYGVKIMPKELNICILLSLTLGALLRIVFGSSMLSSALAAIVATLFLLALVKKQLSVENYRGIGTRYVLYNLVFTIVFRLIIVAGLFGIAALLFRVFS